MRHIDILDRLDFQEFKVSLKASEIFMTLFAGLASPRWRLEELVAVTPGQSLVLYESNVCLGGGIIGGTD